MAIRPNLGGAELANRTPSGRGRNRFLGQGRRGVVGLALQKAEQALAELAKFRVVEHGVALARAGQRDIHDLTHARARARRHHHHPIGQEDGLVHVVRDE